ncbi:hypothetical protein P170DRAFT_249457 [Aspergillus steynii IBT 23096]|uniref:Uncharacterized protein n=1 Tax=Aspergillus steynii IBT 23096 TaxID=1392250 RepID=A0A2I2FYN2_9EURO|nr:uncharacterized protein P170DRAFT_249457 [Aspergillus steynii IBT 23096]PLB45666.1 hypothetical protein P170DRAFT_249457 [Aspergillus steynii IBT 23096]
MRRDGGEKVGITPSVIVDLRAGDRWGINHRLVSSRTPESKLVEIGFEIRSGEKITMQSPSPAEVCDGRARGRMTTSDYPASRPAFCFDFLRVFAFSALPLGFWLLSISLLFLLSME